MLDGRRLTFGFEGIYQGTAVLYDHQTDSLWMHLTGECFAGELEGRALARLDTGRHTTWEDWRSLHPGTTVLAPEERWMRQPGDSGYFSREAARSGAAFLPPTFRSTIHDVDARLEPSALVYGVRVGGRAKAYAFKDLAENSVVDEEFEGQSLTVWYDAQSESAAAFDRRLEQMRLTFAPGAKSALYDAAGRRRDQETGSLWTMDGVCVAGPLKGRRLRALDGLKAEWYGWYANHPETQLWGSP